MLPRRNTLDRIASAQRSSGMIVKIAHHMPADVILIRTA
jgi:hypothetical protein